MRRIGSTLAPLTAAVLLVVALTAAHVPLAVAVLAGAFLMGVAVVTFGIPMDQVAFGLVALLVLVITWNGFRLVGGALSNLFMVLAVAAIVLQVLVARKSIPLPSWLLAAGIGFGLAAMLNVIFPPDGTLINETLIQYRLNFHGFKPPGFLAEPSDLLTLAKFELALFLIPVMVAAVATTAHRINRLIDAFTLSAAINGLVGLIGFALDGGRAAGLTIHPNYLALTCAIAVPLALLWISRGGRWVLPGFTAVLFLLGGEYASGSRAGAIAALLAVVATVAAIPRLRRGVGVALPLAGMAVVAVLLFTNTGQKAVDQLRLGSDLSTTVSTTGSDSSRSQLASLAWDQFQARPVQGVGISVIETAHDIYLQLLSAAGVIGLVSFFIFLGGLGSSTLRALRGPTRDAALAAGIGVLVWLANGVFDSQLADKYLYVIPGLLVAMGCVASRVRAAEPESLPKRVIAEGWAPAGASPT